MRLRSLGDCVLTTPAIQILKDARPDLRISVVVETRFHDIFVPNPAIDEILQPSVSEVRAFKPDLCINLHGGARSAKLTAFSGARWRAGFANFRFPFVYNVKIPTAQQILRVARKVHTAEHVASAMFYLGAERREIPRARLFVNNVKRARPDAYAVLHPAASQPDKTWPAASFLKVARDLKDLQPVFIGGPGEDLSAFQEFPVVQNAPLEQIKHLVRDAAMFVGNDSGPAHMAAAFGLPVVVIFGNSDPVVWAPWRTTAEVLTGNPISAVTPEQVLERMRVHA